MLTLVEDRFSGRLLLSTFLTVCLALALARPASAVQASGSVAVIPNPSVVRRGSAVQEAVRIRNTASDTGADGSAAVAATLHGSTLVTLACADSDCKTPLPGALTFASCAILDAGVCSCGLDPADTTKNTVKITTCPAGVALGAAGSKNLVSITVTASTAPAGGKLFTRAATGANALQACSSAKPTICATAGSQASALVSFSEGK